MSMADVAIALAITLVFLLTCWVLFVVLPNLRAARRLCPGCGHRFGNKAVSVGVPYYERLYGKGVRVMDGPRRYLAARVVAYWAGACGELARARRARAAD